MSAKIHRIELSEDERRELETIRDRGYLKAKTFKKALALLLCDESRLGPAMADEAICKVVGMSPGSVLRLRQRCCETGPLGALVAKLRDKPAREIKVTGEIEARITQLACSEPPEGSARWTLRLLALMNSPNSFYRKPACPSPPRAGIPPATITNTCAKGASAGSSSRCPISAPGTCSSVRTGAGPPRTSPPASITSPGLFRKRRRSSL